MKTDPAIARTARTLILLGVAALVGCSDGDDGAAPHEAVHPRPLRVRLLDDPSSALIDMDWSPSDTVAHLTEGLSPILGPDFAASLSPFRPHLEPAPLIPDGTTRPAFSIERPAAPRTVAEADEHGHRGLVFPAASGAVWSTMELRPDTTYCWRSSIKVGGGGVYASSAALVGHVLLLELRRPPDPSLPPMAAVKQAGIAGRQHLQFDGQIRHLMPTRPIRADDHVPPEHVQAHDLETVWTSSIFTRALMVVLVAGDPGWWLGDTELRAPPPGAVSFERVSLIELPYRRALAKEVKTEQELVRKVAVGAVTRPAMLFPGTATWSLPVESEGGRVTVELAHAVVEESRPEWGRRPLRFSASLHFGDRRHELPLSPASLTPGSDISHAGWHESRIELDLPAGSGWLELTVDAGSSEDVGVFAEPQIIAREPAPEPLPPVLLISLDTLRADHLGCYGYRRADGLEVSPHLDRFAAEDCVVFERAYATAPYTLPSHATMMTGLYPSEHGVTDRLRRLVPGRHHLLAVSLARAGYATAGFTAGGYISDEYGFDHGFDRYSILDPLLGPEDRFRDNFPRRGDRARNDRLFSRCDRAAAARWMLAQEDRPFFAFLHSYVVHNYKPPAHLRERFAPDQELDGFDMKDVDLEFGRRPEGPPEELRRNLIDLYDATIAAVDEELGALFQELKDAGLWDRLWIIVTSDHGEEFGEHGGLVHGRSLYEEMQRVPLLVKIPGLDPGRVRSSVDLCDLFPTLIEAAGDDSEPTGPGRSLRLRVREQAFADQVWHEVRAPNQAEIYALQRWPHKLIHTPDDSEVITPAKRLPVPVWQLFDLSDDDAEQVELLAQRGEDPEVTQRFELLSAEIRRLRADFLRRQKELLEGSEGLQQELSEALRAQLDALGYSVDDE